MERGGRVVDRDWSHYDFRHVVFHPAGMTAAELQDGADWLYAQFYRLDRILLRFLRGVFAVGLDAGGPGAEVEPNLSLRQQTRADCRAEPGAGSQE